MTTSISRQIAVDEAVADTIAMLTAQGLVAGGDKPSQVPGFLPGLPGASRATSSSKDPNSDAIVLRWGDEQPSWG